MRALVVFGILLFLNSCGKSYQLRKLFKDNPELIPVETKRIEASVFTEKDTLLTKLVIRKDENGAQENKSLTKANYRTYTVGNKKQTVNIKLDPSLLPSDSFPIILESIYEGEEVKLDTTVKVLDTNKINDLFSEDGSWLTYLPYILLGAGSMLIIYRIWSNKPP